MNPNVVGKPREWTYEELCSLCRELALEIDEKRWTIGDTALAIETQYNEHTLLDFAKDIGQRRSTIYQYAAVSKFYGVEIRAKIREELPNITYTYLRDAMRLGNVNRAYEFLDYASSEGWSADEASRMLTERLGKETRNSAEGEIHGYGDFDTYHTITFKVSSDDLAWLLHVKKVVIRPK